ncbi:Bbp19 family protein [Burkholderia cenocepacia]|uniref:Bbp19 family protein n=1 Tax=Burkholderia cenocepacia TaxID=95486 RepID=UPI002230F316|nr:hypothetical protein [Burkholderia cenocepacia]MCW3505657.1 hypothetical protein [Burkholderia cenocepacia]MCW3513202.1 hypothetical protein [Burkholderia cenocepacia]MCW3520804.1 hypothetical protein [Burkholderia cenocepacia]MCW3535981.1 hypothetical protein [Burkholderia cenocepacia]MCW3551041.1 hypothetical protein [Burkholderia cenocepacia]
MREPISRFLRFWNRREQYRRCFCDERGKLTPAGEAVLADLAQFCRANQSTVITSPVQRTIDPLATMIAEGRREVFVRLIHILGMEDAALNSLKDEAPE